MTDDEWHLRDSASRECVRRFLIERIESAKRSKRAHELGSRHLEAKRVQERIEELLTMWSAFLGTEVLPDARADVLASQRDST